MAHALLTAPGGTAELLVASEGMPAALHRAIVPSHGLLIDPWVQEARLTASDGAQEDQFGTSVAVSGDTAVVGARFAFVDGNIFQGAVYVFTRDGESWTEQARLTASNGAAFDNFGFSVALSEDGDTALVGAVGDTDSQGAAYVFTRDDEVWSEQAKLTANDGAAFDNFGNSVSLSGDTALVGAPTANVDGNAGQGAAYVFTRSGEIWTEQVKLTANDGAASELFGLSVSLSVDMALVGATGASVGGNLGQGAAYVFTRDGEVWSEQAKLTANDGAAFDNLGRSVSLSVDTALAGAPEASVGGNFGQGAAYVFTRDGEVWSEQAKLTADDGAASDSFGVSVSLAADTALVGAGEASVGGLPGQGATYVFTRDGVAWSEQAKLTADDGAGSENFGTSTAISADTAVIGAPFASVDGNPQQGTAYVFHEFELPPDSALIGGTIHSLGHCNADLQPLADATVEIVGQNSTFFPEVGNDGSYLIILPDSESPIDITTTAADHLPVTIEDLAFTGGDTVEQDIDLLLDAPCATVEPTAISVALEPDQTTTEALTIGNVDGAAELSWEVATSEPEAVVDRTADVAPTGAGEIVDCENEPGIIVHDDGTVEAGYAGAPPEVNEVVFVDRFTPDTYPAAFRAVCLALNSTHNPFPLDFEIVVFDDDGTEGGPGTELGALPASGVVIPSFPTLEWFSFDISSLGISIDSGSVYIGARWPVVSEQQNVFVLADESMGNPVGFAGGYWWNDHSGVWTRTQDNFGGYRSLFVRAVRDLSGCQDPTVIPWLGFDPASGSTPAGGTSEVLVHFDATDLDVGEHQASLCISTNDASTPLVVVPVTLVVNGGSPSLTFDPSSLDFGEVPMGETSAPQIATLNNTGDTIAIGVTFSGLPDSGFEADTSGCGDTLPPLGSCPVTFTFTPSEPGPATAALHAESAEGATADLDLTGAGLAAGIVSPVALDVDPEAFLSNGNGVFEPGELVEVMPSWRNDGLFAESLAGGASEYGGADGGIYFLALDAADYGTVEPGATTRCDATGVCYFLGVNAPNGRPATHWEASFEETLSEGTTKTWDLHIGDSFTDVPRTELFYRAIETLLHHGVTGGCTVTEYCPSGGNTRGQMAVFLLKAAEGAGYVPPACMEGDEVFDDIPFDDIFCPWVEELAGRGVTAGCGGGNYCPGASVTREQMAVFLLRAFEGGGYTPPPCTGEFSDVACPSLFADWIEELSARGITGGCTGDPPAYCPASPVTRGQMAVFVTRTFGLKLYGP